MVVQLPPAPEPLPRRRPGRTASPPRGPVAAAASARSGRNAAFVSSAPRVVIGFPPQQPAAAAASARSRGLEWQAEADVALHRRRVSGAVKAKRGQRKLPAGRDKGNVNGAGEEDGKGGSPPPDVLELAQVRRIRMKAGKETSFR